MSNAITCIYTTSKGMIEDFKAQSDWREVLSSSGRTARLTTLFSGFHPLLQRTALKLYMVWLKMG